jgi:NgoFVII restriction endonuclease
MDLHIYATSKAAQSESNNDIKDAYDALVDNTNWSKSVIFISAYYGVCFADQLFRICKHAKMARDITLIFASAANSNRHTQIDDLNRLSGLLRTSGHAKRRINIMIATKITFLHSKVFAFTSPGGHKRYMLGSANFSSAAFSTNDEVLVLERGRHAGLESYITYVVDHSSSIDEVGSISNQPIKDWRSFFREGFLYFKPSRQVPYTVNCFVGHDFAGTVKSLEEATAGTALRFHDQGSMGSLNLALLMEERTVGTGGTKKRVSMSAFAIETAFGLWVPSAYVDQVEDRIESASTVRRQELMDQGCRLGAISEGIVAKRIQLYFQDIDSHPPLKHLHCRNVKNND